MTRIDFYVLPSNDPHGRRLMACKLAEKAWRMGLKIYMRTSSPDDAAKLDDLLWTFRQGSFIPHGVLGSVEVTDMPVLIGVGTAPEPISDLMINLATDLPADFEHFERVAELVDEDEAIRQAGRERYRVYKERGFAPETHRMDADGGSRKPAAIEST